MYTFHGLNINRNIFFACLCVTKIKLRGLLSVVCFSKAWFGLEEASSVQGCSDIFLLFGRAMFVCNISVFFLFLLCVN